MERNSNLNQLPAEKIWLMLYAKLLKSMQSGQSKHGSTAEKMFAYMEIINENNQPDAAQKDTLIKQFRGLISSNFFDKELLEKIITEMEGKNFEGKFEDEIFRKANELHSQYSEVNDIYRSEGKKRVEPTIHNETPEVAKVKEKLSKVKTNQPAEPDNKTKMTFFDVVLPQTTDENEILRNIQNAKTFARAKPTTENKLKVIDYNFDYLDFLINQEKYDDYIHHAELMMINITASQLPDPKRQAQILKLLEHIEDSNNELHHSDMDLTLPNLGFENDPEESTEDFTDEHTELNNSVNLLQILIGLYEDYPEIRNLFPLKEINYHQSMADALYNMAKIDFVNFDFEAARNGLELASRHIELATAILHENKNNMPEKDQTRIQHMLTLLGNEVAYGFEILDEKSQSQIEVDETNRKENEDSDNGPPEKRAKLK